MDFYRKAEFNKRAYPPGTRIELISMDDPYSPIEPGTRGSVVMVDDVGSLIMKWDNGRGLNLIPGEDQFRKLTLEEVEAERLVENAPVNQEEQSGMTLRM